MMRMQIELEPDQYERLMALASRQSKSLSQPVRDGVEHVLAAEQREVAWERFLAAAGSCRAEDDPGDVSLRDDAYLSDAFALDDGFSRQGSEHLPRPPT